MDGGYYCHHHYVLGTVLNILLILEHVTITQKVTGAQVQEEHISSPLVLNVFLFFPKLNPMWSPNI